MIAIRFDKICFFLPCHADAVYTLHYFRHVDAAIFRYMPCLCVAACFRFSLLIDAMIAMLMLSLMLPLPPCHFSPFR